MCVVGEGAVKNDEFGFRHVLSFIGELEAQVGAQRFINREHWVRTDVETAAGFTKKRGG